MRSKQLRKDKMLGNLIKKASLDSPGREFTSRIMAQVQATAHVNSMTQQPLISGKLWVVIGFALATLVVTVFFIDFSFLGSIFNGLNFDQTKFVPFFSNIINTTGEWFAEVKFSSVTIMILVSIGALVLIERLLRKQRPTQTLMV